MRTSPCTVRRKVICRPWIGAPPFARRPSCAYGYDPASASNGVLETANSGPPEYLGDAVTASRNGASTVANMVGSRVAFIDGFGAQVSFYPQNGTVYVRVVEPSRDSAGVIDTVHLSALAFQSPTVTHTPWAMESSAVVEMRYKMRA